MSKPEEGNDTVTAMPRVTVRQYSRNTMFLIGGRCEEGAVIHVTGGLTDIVSSSDHGDFLVEVPFDGDEQLAVLLLTAVLPGKEPSREVIFHVAPQSGIVLFDRTDGLGIFVARDYQAIFRGTVPDFEGTNLLNQDQMASLTERTANRIQTLRDAGAGTEIIYLIVPNPMNIYYELMPDVYTRHTENSRLRQFGQAVEEGGGTVLDLTGVMMEHKNDEHKIFHKTDSHWTQYGALLGYTALFDRIGQRFPDAASRSMNDFNIYNEQRLLGDIHRLLDLSETCSLTETTAFVDFNFEPPTGHPKIYRGNSLSIDHNVVGGEHITRSGVEGDLPTAVIYRDSCGGPIYAFMTDRFSTAMWRGWGEYTLQRDFGDIAESNIDYIIYIITEHNIGDVLYD
jgi:hypothetical protein